MNIFLIGSIIMVVFFNLNSEQRNLVEMWNWEAAYERQIFLDEQNGKDSDLVGKDTIEWDKIIVDGSFSRTSDVILSLFIWVMIILLSVLYIGGINFKYKNFTKDLILF